MRSIFDQANRIRPMKLLATLILLPVPAVTAEAQEFQSRFKGKDTKAAISAVTEETGHPNILYIFTDDQSRRTVSAYEESHDWVKTPHAADRAARAIHSQPHREADDLRAGPRSRSRRPASHQHRSSQYSDQHLSRIHVGFSFFGDFKFELRSQDGDVSKFSRNIERTFPAVYITDDTPLS